MELIMSKQAAVFDLDAVKSGYLMYGKHMSWDEGKSGFVTSVTEKRIVVQYHPGIGNVTNHYFIPIEEVLNGEWKIRWSPDLSEINEYNADSVDDKETEEETEKETEGENETGGIDI